MAQRGVLLSIGVACTVVRITIVKGSFDASDVLLPMYKSSSSRKACAELCVYICTCVTGRHDAPELNHCEK